MKLANIMYQGMQRIALADGQNLAVLDSDAPPTVELARNPDSAAQCNVIATIPIEEAEFLQPVLRPGKIICVGVNYHAHAAEGGGRQQDPAYPSLFVRFPESQVAHGGEIPMPSVSEQLDFEGELAVVIGQAAWRVSVEQAGKHILGYSCFAENAVRDFQRHSGQATAGKNFLHSGAFGPWLVTPDEVGPLASLNLRTRLNGVEMQHTELGEMIFSVERIISYISQFTQLLPGDVIATGTPAGVGALRSPPLWMKAGDKLEIEIDRVGCLKATVVAERPPAIGGE